MKASVRQQLWGKPISLLLATNKKKKKRGDRLFVKCHVLYKIEQFLSNLSTIVFKIKIK